MTEDTTRYIPTEMIDHIGSFLPFKDFLNLCTAHRGMNALFHHPSGRSVYIDRYTKEIKYKYPDRTEWKYNGKLHREHDQPAIVFSNGSKQWWYHGKRHRENDQPAVVDADGYKAWWYHDNIHRENDQPAVVYADGYKAWWYHGKRHREHDQPAIVLRDGSKSWWYHGKPVK